LQHSTATTAVTTATVATTATSAVAMVNKQELIDAMDTLRLALQGDIQAGNSKLKSEMQAHKKTENSKLKTEIVSAFKDAIDASESKMRKTFGRIGNQRAGKNWRHGEKTDRVEVRNGFSC
jgi:hypothetical protein